MIHGSHKTAQPAPSPAVLKLRAAIEAAEKDAECLGVLVAVDASGIHFSSNVGTLTGIKTLLEEAVGAVQAEIQRQLESAT